MQQMQSQLATTEAAATTTSVTAVPIQRYNFGGNWQFRFAPMATVNFNAGAAMQQQQAIAEQANQAANAAANQTVQAITAKMQEAKQRLDEKYGPGLF
jgi:hypothetical protein